MNKLFSLAIAALVLQAAPLAQAWTYSDGDVLLIFRNVQNPNNDVEYDIGSVNQFLGKTNGYTATVTNWNPAIVQGVYGTDLTGLSVALLAVTSPTNSSNTAWVSGIEPNTAAYGDSLSDWNSSYYSIIDAIGVRPLTYSVPTASTNAYSINPGGKYKAAAYEYIAGAYNGVSQLGGGVPFIVEQIVPGALDFWAVQPLGGSSPDKLVGRFNLTASGTLTFTAGPSAASVTGIARSGNVSSVNIGTTVGVTYQLVGSPQLGPNAIWAPVGSSLVGDGTSRSLNDTNSSDTEFYRVTAQ
jgi:hypothetical protein